MYQSLLTLDHRLFHFINSDLSNPVFDLLMPILRNKLTWIPVYILLAIYTLRKYKKNAWKYIAFIAILFFLSDFLTFHLLKPFFHRSRPCFDTTFHVRLLLESCGGLWGFPSSHASNHMAISLAIILCGIFRSKLINTILFLWALLVGFAQIYVGVHYPADIVAGFTWGGFLTTVVYFAFRRFLKENKGG